ncbi:hypothetical protein [Geodermatophilus ruber]|uniref:Phytase-like domain-containing protein n=1 Tax=Geodermatophilus ruber TaxID=504800 RepID=A0A1I4G795_9ACTN|nr:hypothetical protein [Geodermatophilus ruber]SFL25719.1 hypothetical protein SAMN04488085_108179 [Geodermatophilus ruber]
MNPVARTFRLRPSRSLRLATAGGMFLAAVPSLTAPPVVPATVTATLIADRPTSTWDRPSPDPSGITYLPATNQLLISDGEVEETPLYAGTNLFLSSLDGKQPAGFPGGTSLPWTKEPTGIDYWPATGDVVVTDDDADRVLRFTAGPDGRYGARDDEVASFATAAVGSGDPEDATVLTDLMGGSRLFVVEGSGARLYDFTAGVDDLFDGVPPAGDDTVVVHDVGRYGARDPEGVEYHPGRNTLLVLDGSTETVYELDLRGELLNTVDISAANPLKAGGIALAPASDGSGELHLYIVDRGLDNDFFPHENDGRFYEMSLDLPPLAGRGATDAPAGSPGADLTVLQPDAAAGGALPGGELRPPIGVVAPSRSQVGGPGSVSFARPEPPAGAGSVEAVAGSGLRLLQFSSVL